MTKEEAMIHTLAKENDELKAEIGRLRQALEQQPSDDCVSRQAVIDYLHTNMAWYDENGSIADDDKKVRDITNLVNGIPPVTPTHGKCKDCTNYVVGALDEEICIRGHELIHKDFYCADYEKRGNEND